MTIAGQQFIVTASVGLSVYPQHGGTGDDLMRAADGAMYQVKAAGRNRVQIFDPARQAGQEHAMTPKPANLFTV
jgi:diguanylate cyclase (GGDEF)-like protein